MTGGAGLGGQHLARRSAGMNGAKSSLSKINIALPLHALHTRTHTTPPATGCHYYLRSPVRTHTCYAHAPRTTPTHCAYCRTLCCHTAATIRARAARACGRLPPHAHRCPTPPAFVHYTRGSTLPTYVVTHALHATGPTTATTHPTPHAHTAHTHTATTHTHTHTTYPPHLLPHHTPAPATTTPPYHTLHTPTHLPHIYPRPAFRVDVHHACLCLYTTLPPSYLTPGVYPLSYAAGCAPLPPQRAYLRACISCLPAAWWRLPSRRPPTPLPTLPTTPATSLPAVPPYPPCPACRVPCRTAHHLPTTRTVQHGYSVPGAIYAPLPYHLLPAYRRLVCPATAFNACHALLYIARRLLLNRPHRLPIWRRQISPFIFPHSPYPPPCCMRHHTTAVTWLCWPFGTPASIRHQRFCCACLMTRL